nr:MAG TPA: hypothetical protein [Caudoviricetes sp.]
MAYYNLSWLLATHDLAMAFNSKLTGVRNAQQINQLLNHDGIVQLL